MDLIAGSYSSRRNNTKWLSCFSKDLLLFLFVCSNRPLITFGFPNLLKVWHLLINTHVFSSPRNLVTIFINMIAQKRYLLKFFRNSLCLLFLFSNWTVSASHVYSEIARCFWNLIYFWGFGQDLCCLMFLWHS